LRKKGGGKKRRRERGASLSSAFGYGQANPHLPLEMPVRRLQWKEKKKKRGEQAGG